MCLHAIYTLRIDAAKSSFFYHCGPLETVSLIADGDGDGSQLHGGDGENEGDGHELRAGAVADPEVDGKSRRNDLSLFHYSLAS